MATKRRTSRWRYIRKLAWERDRKANAVCGICGQPIDYSLEPSSTEDSWEPDHIVAVSIDNSKELDLNNIRATHRRCNRGRSNKDVTILGQVSRIW